MICLRNLIAMFPAALSNNCGYLAAAINLPRGYLYMADYILKSGNTTLVFEALGDYYVPVISITTDDGDRIVLTGGDFIKIYVDEQPHPVRVRKLWRMDGLVFEADVEGIPDIHIKGEIHPSGELALRFQWSIDVKNNSDSIIDLRVGIEFAVNDSGTPRWMVPAIFYKDNRPEGCKARYPRFATDQYDPSQFVSNYWMFRSDRSSCPSAFCWTDNFTSCLATSAVFSDGISGIGFSAQEDQIKLFLNYPYVEAPVSYAFHHPNANRPQYTTVPMAGNTVLSFRFCTYVDERDLHLYDSLIRDIYSNSDDESNPWMSKAACSELTAYGLYNWHYDKENHILNETCAFDSYFGKGAGQVDRPHMHVSWVSGIPYAYALWKYGQQVCNEDYIAAGISVIDKIASEGISPSGFFYAEWTKESGWGTGWNPNKDWIQSRTIGEAVWFLVQSAECAKQLGINKPLWESAIRDNLESALRAQRDDGNMGTYYDVNTGEVQEWDGAGGIVWITAFLAASQYFADDRYKDAAIRAAVYYRKFVDDEYIYGAPEDVHLTPTSEDGYNALIAYLHLYEATEDENWLELAEVAADWMLSFRWTYNVSFSPTTILGQYDFKTIGADNASPSNNHLHPYGLICHWELLRLWEYTSDTYYLGRAADNLSCFQQFIAREDGDFNARKGMVSEQWYHTDWNHPKGSMLQLAHTWCAGMILYANICSKDYGDIIIDAESREVYVLDNIEIENLEYLDPDLVLTLRNQTFSERALKVRHSKLGVVGEIKIGIMETSRVLIGGIRPKIEYLEEDNWSY